MHVYFICLFMQKGKKNLVSLYMHVSFISSFMQKGGKEFGEFMHVYFLVCVSMCYLVYAFH